MTQKVAVIGAGMVGLSTAWFLQEAGVQVTVYERDQVGAGASWGNAGWLTPALTAPLPEPAVLRYGLRAVLSPRRRCTCRCAPTARCCASWPASRGTARRGGGGPGWPRTHRSTSGPWRRSTCSPPAGCAATHRAADPFLACFRRDGRRGPAGTSSSTIRAAGQDVDFRPVTGRRGAGDGAGAVRPRWRPRCRSTASATCTRRSSSRAPGRRGPRPRRRGARGRGVTDLRGHERGGVAVVAADGERTAVRRGRGRHRRLAGRARRRGSACGSRCRPAAATASACPSSRCRAGPLYFPTQRVAARSRRWAAGCGWPG